VIPFHYFWYGGEGVMGMAFMCFENTCPMPSVYVPATTTPFRIGRVNGLNALNSNSFYWTIDHNGP
jgi:hypothetical protein